MYITSFVSFCLLLWIIGNLRMWSEKAVAPHSSTLAWKIPWTEEPGRLQTMGSGRVDWATSLSLSLFTFMHWRRKWNPLQCSCLENPRDGRAWWAAVCGVAQSWTRLKQLSSSSKDVMVAEIGCLTNPFPSFWLYCQNVFSACLVVSYMQTEIKPKGSRKKWWELLPGLTY